MLEKVKNQHFVTFVGVQGSGKTATVRHIALKLQEEGYDIFQIREMKDIETYFDPTNLQVFVFDDMLGLCELEMSGSNMLNTYEDILKHPKMSKIKTLFTCRKEVFKNKVVFNSFLSKEENVVLMQSDENAFTIRDKDQVFSNRKNYMTTELIKAEASVNKRVRKEPTLTAACYARHLDIVKALIKRGVDVNLPDSKTTSKIAACEKA